MIKFMVWVFVIGISLIQYGQLNAAFEDKVGVRALSMGGAFVAISDDASAPFWNPAGISLMKKVEFVSSTSRRYVGLDKDNLNFSFLSYVHPIGVPGSFGASANFFSSKNYTERVLSLSYGKCFFEHRKLAIGVSLKSLTKQYKKNIYTQIDPFFSDYGYTKDAFGIDIGVICYPIGGLSTGFVVRNLNEPNLALADGEVDKLSSEYQVGVSYDFGIIQPAVDLEYNFRKYSNHTKKIRVGVEGTILKDKVYLRTGYNPQELTIGASYQFLVKLWEGAVYDILSAAHYLQVNSLEFRLNYGFLLPLNTIGQTYGSHYFSLNIAFGVSRTITDGRLEEGWGTAELRDEITPPDTVWLEREKIVQDTLLVEKMVIDTLFVPVEKIVKDTVLVETEKIVVDTVTVERVIIDTLVVPEEKIVIDTVIVETEKLVVDTVTVERVVIDTLLVPIEKVKVDTLVVEKARVDTFVIAKVHVDTVVVPLETVRIDTVVKEVVKADTLFVEKVVHDTLIIEDSEHIEKLKEQIGISKEELERKNDEINRALWHLTKALEYYYQKKFVEAKKECETAISIAPYIALAYMRLGSIYLKLGQPAKAIEEWEKSLSIDPENPELRRMLNELKQKR